MPLTTRKWQKWGCRRCCVVVAPLATVDVVAVAAIDVAPSLVGDIASSVVCVRVCAWVCALKIHGSRAPPKSRSFSNSNSIPHSLVASRRPSLSLSLTAFLPPSKSTRRLLAEKLKNVRAGPIKRSLASTKYTPRKKICSFSGSNREPKGVFRPSFGSFESSSEAEAPFSLVGPNAMYMVTRTQQVSS